MAKFQVPYVTGTDEETLEGDTPLDGSLIWARDATELVLGDGETKGGRRFLPAPENSRDREFAAAKFGMGPRRAAIALHRLLFDNASSPVQLPVITTGDSIAQGPYYLVLNYLNRMMGGASSALATTSQNAIFSASFPGSYLSVPNGSSGLTNVANDFTRWFDGTHQLLLPGTYNIRNPSGAFNPVADDLRLYFIAEAGGGVVEVFDNGVSQGTIDTDSGSESPTLGKFKWTRGSANGQAITITVTGASVRMLRGSYRDTTKPGVWTYPSSLSGIKMIDAVSSDAARAIWRAVIDDILTTTGGLGLISNRKNDSFDNGTPGDPSDDYDVAVGKFADDCDAVAPLADIVLLAANPNWGTHSNQQVIDTNREDMKVAAERGYLYVDLYSRYGGEAYETDQDLIPDEVHPSQQEGYALEAWAIMDALDLWGLSYTWTPRAVNDQAQPSYLAPGTSWKHPNAAAGISVTYADGVAFGYSYKFECSRAIDIVTTDGWDLLKNGRTNVVGDNMLRLPLRLADAGEGTRDATSRRIRDASLGGVDAFKLERNAHTTPVSAPLQVSAIFDENGNKVLGAQGAAVADPSGGATVDAEARVTLMALLAELRAVGVVAE